MIETVSIESPYHNENPKLLQRNICYAILAVKDSIRNYNEAPYASHLLHTQFVYQGQPHYVGDHIPDPFGCGREAVIEITHTMRKKMDKIVFYTDFGYSRGMLSAKQVAEENDIPIEERTLPPEMLASLEGDGSSVHPAFTNLSWGQLAYFVASVIYNKVTSLLT